MKRKTETSQSQSKAAIQTLVRFSKKDIDQIYSELDTDKEGLSDEAVAEKIEKYGLNQLTHEKSVPWYKQLIKSFIDPFTLVLMTLAVISFITDVLLSPPESRSFKTVIVISTLVAISGFLKFSQEYRSSKAADKLKTLISSTSDILRKKSGIQEIDVENIVPGDIISLAAGDIIPADLRLIVSNDLLVSESSLTGESEPVEKVASPLNSISDDTAVTELSNICLLGTTIASGSATGIVLATGDATYFSSIASSIVTQKNKTSFDKGIKKISLLLIRLMILMVPLVFVVNGITKGDWLQALLFAISIAVGLTPEMLPVIVTTNLAKGAILMGKHKTVVKELDAIQNFGAMDILCTDKTGTLTMDEMTVTTYLNARGEEDPTVLRKAYLNSFFQTGLRNLMDVAVLEKGKDKGFSNLEYQYSKVEEIPFDFIRRRISVVLKDAEGKNKMITKGAYEEIIGICTQVENGGKIEVLTAVEKKEALDRAKKLSSEGIRVIAIAQKEQLAASEATSKAEEKELVLAGFVGFLDPVKESAGEALKVLEEDGIDVKILTGDSGAVTLKVCQNLGLVVQRVLLGNEIGKMSDEELAAAVEETSVFAKLEPLQKSRIIQSLQEKAHIVGYMGDGINDAAALHQADVGISVDTAVGIAKDSADIILLEKDLRVLEEGVIEGRKVFGNIMKYIKITVSSNFGNVFSVLLASLVLPFLPMLPIQLLVQNLLYNISQLAIPWDTMDQEYLKKPRKWNADDIGKFMLFVGPISSIFDVVTFLVMWFIFKANTPAMQSLFQTGWFVVGLLSQTLIVHMIRTEKIPFIESRATLPVMALSGGMMLIGAGLPFTPFGTSIGLTALPLAYFPWLIGILFSYSLLLQLVKKRYIKRFNRWL